MTTHGSEPLAEVDGGLVRAGIERGALVALGDVALVARDDISVL